MFDKFFEKKEKAKRRERKLRLITSGDAPFGFVEAFKSLRTNIDFLSSTNNYHTILITSSGPWDGKSTVSINLAAAMADSGKKVILVDCDLRKGSISTYLKISRSAHGTTNVLAHQNILEEVIVHSEIGGLDILPVGPLPPNPAEIIGSEGMINMIQKLATMYDYVFLDTPPVPVVTDAAILSRFVDGVLLVVRADVTTKQAMQLSKKLLEDVDAHILGAILNGYNSKSHSYGSGYYYSYSYDSYGDTPKKTKHRHKKSENKK